MSVQERLEQARYAVGRGIPQRRACTLLSGARSGLDYQCKMPVKDRPIVVAMRQYSEQYPRYGARRVRIFLRRDGLVLGRDRMARIWAGAGRGCVKTPNNLPLFVNTTWASNVNSVSLINGCL